MKEIFPTGFNSWTAFYRAKEKNEKRNNMLKGIAGMLVFFGVIVLDGLTSTIFR